MPQYEPGIAEQQSKIEVSERNSDRDQFSNTCSARDATGEPLPSLTIVVSKPEEVTDAKGEGSKSTALESDEKAGVVVKEHIDCQQCRVCQQLSEEALIDLGCKCRGELAKAHRSCIEIWFRSKGSNKCEICQQVAVNVPLLDYQLTTNYWVWRVRSLHGGSNIERRARERRCFSPPWIAFAILVGGLLLDLLISISLGVSAHPVDIIIGVLIMVGLARVLWLVMKSCSERDARRRVQGTAMDLNIDINISYHPSV
ncbi:hypothetical protein KSP39_PZI000818 [Platanthera zijinensis]|uniref:RING-CH-type domain-containing protein n=1 Tax=Platanthera zijinensis TaxID=2320716 RepID=A0AAP0C1Z1_9ASPA